MCANKNILSFIHCNSVMFSGTLVYTVGRSCWECSVTASGGLYGQKQNQFPQSKEKKTVRGNDCLRKGSHYRTLLRWKYKSAGYSISAATIWVFVVSLMIFHQCISYSYGPHSTYFKPHIFPQICTCPIFISHLRHINLRCVIYILNLHHISRPSPICMTTLAFPPCFCRSHIESIAVPIVQCTKEDLLRNNKHSLVKLYSNT